jgi:hypothetical protein
METLSLRFAANREARERAERQSAQSQQPSASADEQPGSLARE